MEIPKACIDCPLHFAKTNDLLWCGKENKEILADNIQTFKPDWCSLRDLPKKLAVENRWFSEDYAMGFNACLDEILGGELHD